MNLGSYDSERVKQGAGTYIWMGPTSVDDDTPRETARYTGNYVNGQKSGIGKMVYPNGDVYEGQWSEDKVGLFCYCCCYFFRFKIIITSLK